VTNMFGNESPKYVVLISAAASPAASSLVRHLKSLGYYVIGLDSNEDAVALGEYVCDEFYVSPKATDESYIPYIRELLSKIDVFVPFIDEELEILHRLDSNDEIRKKTMLCPSPGALICLDKKLFQDYCESKGLSIAPVAEQAPAVFKPVKGRGGKGIIFASDDDMYNRLNGVKGYLAQALLQGEEYTVDCLYSHSGILKYAVPRKRLLASGVSTIGQVHNNPAVLSLVEKVSGCFDFTGLVNIQVMMVCNRAYLIEINPRISGSIIFSIRSGADLVDIALRDFLGLKGPKSVAIKEKTYIRYWEEYEV